MHDIFAPDTDFTPGAGLWGIQGIVEHQPGEFLLFVTFGKEQGEHKFDEGITTAGVLTWQSQPNQGLDDKQVRDLIAHDSERSNVQLFLRTNGRSMGGRVTSYRYLGRLAYLAHDAERERPVYFQWQLVDTWPPPASVLARMGLVLTTEEPLHSIQTGTVLTTPPGLTETPPPTGSGRNGRRTSDFRGRKSPDRSKQDANNRALGLAGELIVVEHEQQWLRANGRDDLAEQVRHVATIEGDGAGYDVESFALDGSMKFIEVKTTRDGSETPFFISANEIEFSKRHAAVYLLYRIYEFDTGRNSGRFFIKRGSLVVDPELALEPILFRARVKASIAQDVAAGALPQQVPISP